MINAQAGCHRQTHVVGKAQLGLETDDEEDGQHEGLDDPDDQTIGLVEEDRGGLHAGADVVLAVGHGVGVGTEWNTGPPSACLRGSSLYPTHRRAFWKRRNQGPSSCGQSRGSHEYCLRKKQRSGWGIRIVTRPSALVRPVMPSGEPLGFRG
jgi:hypothetical protein